MSKMDICKVGSRVTCTGCSQLYTTRDGSYGRGPRRPLLLTCGHTLCEACIVSTLSAGKDSIECPVCADTSMRDHKDANIHTDFPLSMFVLGAVVARFWTQSTADSQVSFVPPGASTRRHNKGRVTEVPPAQQAAAEMCEECTTRPCDWFCQQCDLKYCNACFAKVHKAKALMKHVKVPPPVGKVKLKEKQLCQVHKDKPLEFYCKQCDCNICAYCFVETHRPHEVISLLEKNKDCMETLEEAYEKGTKMLKQLLSTQKKVESLRQASSKLQAASAAPYARVEQEVVRHFSQIHGVLQHIEQQLLTQLGEARAQHVDSLRTISRQLVDHLVDVREALDNARVALLPANLGLVDVTTVQEKLRQILDLPCHLVTSVTGEANSVEFIVEDSFVEKLASHCRLELRSSVNHALHKFDDLPPDYVADSVDESLPDDVCPPLTHSSRASSVSALGEDVCVISDTQQKSPSFQSPDGKKVMQFAFHERQDNTGQNNTHPVINIALDSANRKKAKNVLQGTSESVIVTHIKDPCDFYVQRQSDQQKVLLQADVYKKLAASSSIPTEVKPGEIYLVCYNVDKNWYRARVVSALSATGGEKEQYFLVQYVDYGNFEKVALSSFRIAPKLVLESPFMAVHCGLHGVHPAGSKWSPEAVKLFAQMVNGSVVLMVMLGYAADKYEVDLCRMPGGGEDVPSSVQDAVVFLGLAHFFNNVERPTRQISVQSDPFYSDKAGLKHGDMMDVSVTHVEHPSSFYLQKVDHSYLLMCAMMEKLGEDYSSIGNKGLVYAPYINMPCAALYSQDKKWYRAKVVDLPGNRLVQVEYVDFGNKELVSWNKIRKLKDQYLQLPAQAIHCALNDVVPPAEMGAKWTAKSSNFLQQRAAGKIMNMFVDGSSEDVLKVTLYEVHPNVLICINALMVREGLARSTGISSTLVEFHKNVDDVANKKLKIPSLLKGRQRQNSGGGNKELPKPPSVQETVVDTTGDDGDDEGPEEEEKGPLKVEVKVLSVVNPSHLYVSIVSQQKAINSMMEELQEFYQQCPKSDKEWAVGDPCAAYIKDKRLWYRAVIIDLPDAENAKVFLKDTADCQLVEVSYIRELSNLFTQLHDGAIRCHLAGIKPAGSSSTWSILATEFLTTLVSQDNLFSITKKGEVENDSLPVELLVKEIVEEGPLIPTIEEWRAINSKLVEQGLAFVIRDGSTSSSMSGGQHLTALDRNTEPEGVSVTQWLTTQKSGKSAGPRKSPKKLLTNNAALNDRSSTVKEKTVKTEERSARKKTNLSDSMVAHASGAESDDVADAADAPEQGSMPPLFDSWLPATPMPSDELWIVPTYVDMKCCIYFHDFQQEETLTVIGNGLNSRFCNSKPKPYDSYWSPGQTCVALYHSDKKWYRGQVISIKEDMTVEVMFVDYGNVEVCKASELRKDVCMTHIPVQCHVAKIHGIAPLSEDGSWPVKTLDFIHMTIVEKKCLVKLRTSATGEELIVSLVGPGDLDFYQLLVSMHYAVLTYASEEADSDGSDAVYIEAQEDTGEDIIIEEETTEKVAARVAKRKGQSKGVSSESEGRLAARHSSTSECETVLAEDRRQDNVSVKEEVQYTGDVISVASVNVATDVSVQETDVKIEDVRVEDNQHVEQGVDGNEPIGMRVLEKDNTVSGEECSSSDASDDSEQQLSRKPQSLMDWYDIITEEEKGMGQPRGDGGDEAERVMYHAMELPELDSFLVEVTAMLSVNEVVLHLEKTETAELRLMKNKFEELTRILQVEAPTQDVLSDASIGQPCCACYSEDHLWYRAMIVDIFDDLKIKIVYVDYGNTETVSANSLREVNAEWLELPVQGVQARLWRLLEAPDQDHQAVIQRLADCLFKPPVIANIQSRAPLTVQILSCKTLEPVYKSLFEDGLLMLEHI